MEKRIEAKGNIIETLEGERFRILELVSESRMSVVYRAERLIEDGKKHNVLLKAFVISEKFEYSLDVYQEYVRHELEINQKLNAIGFTGALTISYVVRGKKDGIVYGVILNIQSGMTLQKYATTANFRYVTLRDRIDIIKKLAVILDEFHKECRMIHGDISPDNIYLQESGMGRNGESSLTVVLLDFGSVQELDDGGREYLPIYAKTDYVHPDIIKGKRNILEKDDDWYGLLCCLWFSFTGRTVIEYAPVEENIYEVYQRIAVSYEQNLFDYAEDSIIQKQIQNYQVIYKKIVELFDTGMKRTDLIIKNLQKILSLIDDNGISTERLFGNLKTEYEQLRESRFSSLHILKDILPYVEFHLPQSTPRFIKTRNKQSQTLHQIMEENQDSLFMIGDGGMGKTTSLIGIMDYEYGELKNSNSPVIFIELSVLSQNCEDWYQEKRGGTFIEQFIASYLTGTPRKFVEKTHPYILPIHIKELQEIYFIDDGAINKKRVFSNLVERVLAELVKKILPLEYLRDECSFELKMFYEKQFYTLSGIRQYYFDVLTKQGLENYSKLLDWTVKASILFAFHSGCKNFSLTWYEKKFRINHFQNKYKDESGKGIDGYTWHRWTVSMDNFEKQENMWEMIALDAKRIRKCYRYLEKNNAELIIKDIYERYNIQRDKVHKECIELLVWMKKHNMGIMDEVVSKLRYCEKELDGN